MPITSADNALVLYRSDKFRGWVMVLLGNVARDVYAEPTGTPNHAIRLTLAQQVLRDPQKFVDRFLNALIGDPEVALLGSLVEDSWTEAHLLQLRAKIVQLWTPLAEDLIVAPPGA